MDPCIFTYQSIFEYNIVFQLGGANEQIVVGHAKLDVGALETGKFVVYIARPAGVHHNHCVSPSVRVQLVKCS